MTAPITAVLVTYNSAHCVGPCLRSLQDVVHPEEIVVVDNDSSDGTPEVVRAVAPDATLVELRSNVGFGRAANLGVEHAHSQHVMFVNPDIVFVRADRDALDDELARDELGLLVPLLVADGLSPHHYVHPYVPWRRWVLSKSWSHLRPREARKRVKFAASPADAWASAALLVARRDEFRSVGGFDPRYFLYMEDVDLSRRYRERQLPLRLTDALVAEHSGAASSASEDDTKPVPLAWSMLGTLEYISIWEGDEAAARAARLALRSLRLQRKVLRRLPGGRFARKRRQVEAIEAFLVAHARAEPDDGSYCPGARVPLRSLV